MQFLTNSQDCTDSASITVYRLYYLIEIPPSPRSTYLVMTSKSSTRSSSRLRSARPLKKVKWSLTAGPFKRQKIHWKGSTHPAMPAHTPTPGCEHVCQSWHWPRAWAWVVPSNSQEILGISNIPCYIIPIDSLRIWWNSRESISQFGRQIISVKFLDIP
jgi:hypothetical protein